MAEFISAKDLPITEAEEVDVLCVDNGELKRKQAKGLGGGGSYIIKAPLSEIELDQENGTITVTLTESYDNFMPIIYAGGNVALDLTELMASMDEESPEGAFMLCQIITHTFVPGQGYHGQLSFMGANVDVAATNGTWTPPTE